MNSELPDSGIFLLVTVELHRWMLRRPLKSKQLLQGYDFRLYVGIHWHCHGLRGGEHAKRSGLEAEQTRNSNEHPSN